MGSHIAAVNNAAIPPPPHTFLHGTVPVQPLPFYLVCLAHGAGELKRTPVCACVGGVVKVNVDGVIFIIACHLSA